MSNRGKEPHYLLWSEEAGASVKPWESHPEPNITYWKAFLTQHSWAVAPSLRRQGQPSPGTARPEFCPSETAVRGVSNGQDPTTAEPQTQAALYSKGVPVQDTAQK